MRHTSYCKKRRFFTSTRVFLWKNLWNCVVQQMLDVCKWCKCKWCKWCLMYVNEYVQIECRLELEKGVDCLVLTTGLPWLDFDMTGIDLNTCVPWLYDNFKQLNLFVTFSIFKKYTHVLFWMLKGLAIEIIFGYFQFCINSYCFVCQLLFLKISWVCFCD